MVPQPLRADRLVSGKHTDVGAAGPRVSDAQHFPSQSLFLLRRGGPPPSDYPLPLRPRWGDRSEEAPSWLRLAPPVRAAGRPLLRSGL